VPGGEYFPDWLPDAIARLHRIAETCRGQTIVAVTHGGVLNASFVAFGRMPPREAEPIRTDNTGITEWACMLDDSGVTACGDWHVTTTSPICTPRGSRAHRHRSLSRPCQVDTWTANGHPRQTARRIRVVNDTSGST
jgi:hypothetical protein